LTPSTTKPVSKPTTKNYEPFDPQKLEAKIQDDLIQDLSNKIVKASIQHPLPDNTAIKKFFDPLNAKSFKDAMGFSSTALEVPLEDNTLTFKLFILSNVRIIESTRNTALQDSFFYILIHFYEKQQLEIVRKQLIGIDTFLEDHARNSSLVYPLAIVGLQNTKVDKSQIDQESKDNFLFDLQSIISKISGLDKRFIIQYFDFSPTNIIDFIALGEFYFERFLKDQKVPTFEEN